MNRRTDAPALEFAGVSLTYHTKEGETLAAADLSFAVEEGEFIAVIGPSGCGKTTLLSLAAGLIAPSSGSIRVRGGEQGAGRFGYMLQRDELFPWRTVEQNILLPLEIRRDRSPQAARRALALAEKYGLGGFLKQYPDRLSGGMRQRAALIRTLAPQPEILLLDEPFKGLDPSLKGRLIKTFVKLYEKERRTVIFVTHAIDEALLLADKIIMIKGSPAVISFESEIKAEKAERNLSDDAFDRLRKKLLECWEQV